MKKNKEFFLWVNIIPWERTFRIMKVLFILITATMVSFATGSYSQSKNLTFRLEKVNLIEIFEQIEKQSDMKVAYDISYINMDQRMNISVDEASIENVLKKALENTNLSYRVMNHYVIISKNENRSSSSLEQQKSITGIVTDSSGASLPGVSVVVKGTTTGTITDANGVYSISNVPVNATLVFSFVGMKTQEVKLTGKSNINVVLEEESVGIEEVIAVGYGTQSKRSLSTSISKMEAKDISIQPVGSVGNALQGLAPGVQVQSGQGGTPGASPVIRIRGVGSIGGSNDVLYVVDGYPLQTTANFNQINLGDIESIEVLKDAASAAIYGSRAANGVIIVTTKRGKSGKAKFEFSGYTGIKEVSKRLDLMNKDQYIAHVKKVAAILNKPYPVILDNPSNLPDTDWQDQIFRKGKVSDYQLSATGGTDNVKYLISGGYYNEEGTLKGTDYSRYNFRFNLDADLSSKIKAGVTMAPSYSEQHIMPASGQWNNTMDGNIGRTLPNVMQNAYMMPPVIDIRTANGDYAQPNAEAATSQYGFFLSNLYNPLATIELVTNRVKNFSFFGNSFLELNLFKNFKFKTSFGSTFNYLGQNGYIPPTVSTNTSSSANISTPDLKNIWAIERSNSDIDWLWENTINYKLFLGKNAQHSFNFMVFSSAQRFNAKQVSSNGKIGTFSNAYVQNPSASNDLQSTIGYDLNAFVSYGGRVTYDCMKRYFITAALRNDGSSKFGPKNRYSTFPSISAAWRVIDEKFMNGTKNWLNDLKFRASFGETGNANIGSFTWANSMIGSNYTFGTTRNSGSTESGISNEDLTWEKNKQYDLGLDIALMDGRVTVGFDYYNRTTDGMLMNKDLAGIYGYATTARQNMGSMENTGLEATLGTNLKIGKVTYTADYNFSVNTNEVTSLGGPTSLPSQTPVYGWGNMYQIVVGQPVGNINGFIVEGIFKNTDDLAKYPQWNGNGNLVGDWRIKDVSGDGKITEADRTTLGNAVPKYTFATTQRFAFNNFDLSFMFQGVAKVSLLAGDFRQLYYGVTGLSGNVNLPTDVIDNFFDPANPDKDVKFHRIGGITGVTMNNQATNYSVLEASYLRLQNVTLGYNLPQGVINHAKINSARIYMSCQNLFTITKYPGVNPEANNASNGYATNSNDNPFMPGVDQGAYPSVRTITFGLNIGF